MADQKILHIALLVLAAHAAADPRICSWIESHTTYRNFDDFHAQAPLACVPQSEFHMKLAKNADAQIKAGVLSPEAAYNFVVVWTNFVPTFKPTIAGLTKTYKCDTNETISLYYKMMSAVGSAARNQKMVSQPASEVTGDGSFIVLSGDDAVIENAVFKKHTINPGETLSSSTVIAAPDAHMGYIGGGSAVYTVRNTEPKSYTMFIRSRGLSPSGGYFMVSSNIFGFPSMMVSAASENSNFAWSEVTSAVVNEPGLLRLRIASFSPLVEIDTIVLHSGVRDRSSELDYLALSHRGIVISARDVSPDDHPGFQLVQTGESLSGAVLRTNGSINIPKQVTFNVFLTYEGNYTVYLLARGLNREVRTRLLPAREANSGVRKWPVGVFSWQTVGSHASAGGVPANLGVDGEDVEIACAFLHVNPNLVEMELDTISNAATQAGALDRECGNGRLDYGEECERSATTGVVLQCEECRCVAGFVADGQGRCVREFCFGERDGNIVIQAEMAVLPVGWKAMTSLEGYSGDGFITFSSYTNQPPKQELVLQYKVFSEHGGEYVVHPRATRLGKLRSASANRNKQNNDMWLYEREGPVAMVSSFGDGEDEWVSDSSVIGEGRRGTTARITLPAGFSYLRVGPRSAVFSVDAFTLVRTSANRTFSLVTSPC